MNILQIGCGGVGKALNELFKLENYNIKKLTIIEPLDLPSWVYFTKHIKIAINQENLNKILDPLITKDTYVIDISVNVDCIPIMELCKKRQAKYINTSIEGWDESDEDYDPNVIEINKDNVLFYRLNKVKKVLQGAKSTLLTDQGMNPGLISSCAKFGLEEVARAHKDDESIKYIEKEMFNLAAKRMGLEVIHISELDTQNTKKKMRDDTFYNTWSCVGFQAEALDPVSIGFGSCENNKDKKWIKPTNSKNPDVRIMKKRGCDVIKKSYCLDNSGNVHKISGYCIPHGESYTICKYFRHKDYKPSVYYVYCSSIPAADSIDKLKENGYIEIDKCHVFELSEIASNKQYDSVGALLYFSGKGTIPKIAHWYGTSLSVGQVKKLGFKHGTPTTVQVAISIFSALRWMADGNHKEGFITPEHVQHKYMIENSKKYLGNLISKSFKYTQIPPLSFDKF